MLKYLLLLTIAFCSSVAIGQSLTNVLKIDKMAQSIDSAKNLGQTVLDGTIAQKSKSLFIKKLSGYFSETYYYNKYSKRLLRVSYYSYLKKHEYEDYYFLNDSLILVTTQIGTGTNNKYYFKEDTIFKKMGYDTLITPQYFIKKAIRYLKDFKELPFSK
ncbi:hypothetical protein ACFQZS_09935 [Mucilaginibacter calamicampi]|uniref:DUF4468 domain-containing protein n=1 Tax=Mucilaginibacter calamicampi TaxID=1302352 RepID=A0ABW2YYI0_9SPHI